MLTQHRSVSLTFISTNLPILSQIETVGTLYERDCNKFHLVLSETDLIHTPTESVNPNLTSLETITKGLLWLEISPYRVVMTKQGGECLNYRYFWEQGVYGVNRYWLNDSSPEDNYSFRLRNFTRSLTVKGKSTPDNLRIEYELWSDKLNLGHYVLHLEMN
jgi:hypothetical protein